MRSPAPAASTCAASTSLSGGYVVEMAAAAPTFIVAGTGTIVSGGIPSDGFGLFVFGGGTSAQLVAAAGCSSGRAMFFVLIDGQWVPFIPAAPPSVNARWNAVFGASMAPSTPMLGSCNESRGTEQ